MKTVFTASELMQVALEELNVCMQNAEQAFDVHCHTCGKLVASDYAATVCYPSGHDVETAKRTA